MNFVGNAASKETRTALLAVRRGGRKPRDERSGAERQCPGSPARLSAVAAPRSSGGAAPVAALAAHGRGVPGPAGSRASCGGAARAECGAGPGCGSAARRLRSGPRGAALCRSAPRPLRAPHASAGTVARLCGISPPAASRAPQPRGRRRAAAGPPRGAPCRPPPRRAAPPQGRCCSATVRERAVQRRRQRPRSEGKRRPSGGSAPQGWRPRRLRASRAEVLESPSQNESGGKNLRLSQRCVGATRDAPGGFALRARGSAPQRTARPRFASS